VLSQGSAEAGAVGRELDGSPGFDGVTTVDPGAESSRKADECGLSRNGDGAAGGDWRAGVRWVGAAGGAKAAGGCGGKVGWLSHGETGGAAGGVGVGGVAPEGPGEELVREISDSSQANSVANLEGVSCNFEASFGDTLGRKLELPAAAAVSTICSGLVGLAVAGEVSDNSQASVE